MPPRQALGAVARIAVAARLAVRHRGVLAAERRIAGVGRARIGVVAGEQRARRADAAETDLGAVAKVEVVARQAVGDRGVLTSESGNAGLVRTRVAVVATGGRAGDAGAAEAGLGAVARIAVAARLAVRHGAVLTSERRIAGVGRAGVCRRRTRAPCPAYTSATHVSAPLQTVASSHGLPSGNRACAQPVTASQVSALQGSPSSQSSARSAEAEAAAAGLAAVAHGAVAARRAVGDDRVRRTFHRRRTRRSYRRCRRRTRPRTRR